MHKVYNVSDGTFRWYIDGSQVVSTTPEQIVVMD